MRTLFVSTASLLALTESAAANSCYWLNGHIYCDPMCHVVDRWFDGYREWMRYSCGPPPELLFLGAVVALIAIIVGIAKAIEAATSTGAHQADIQQIERDMALDTELKASIEDAMRKADSHIATMLAKYRDGDHHG